MNKKYNLKNSPGTIAFLAGLLWIFTTLSAIALEPLADKQKHSFQITIETESDTISLKGESELMTTPSSYSINMVEENGSCVIHMLNFKTPPLTGTYDVEDKELVRTAMVCVLEGAEPKERLASKSGTFTITEMAFGYIKGHFDMILTGPVSGKEFHVHGEVTSEKISTNLNFNN